MDSLISSFKNISLCLYIQFQFLCKQKQSLLNLNYRLSGKMAYLRIVAVMMVALMAGSAFAQAPGVAPAASPKRSPSPVASPPQAVPAPRSSPASSPPQTPSAAAPSESPLSSPPAPPTSTPAASTIANPLSVAQAPGGDAPSSPLNAAALNRVALVESAGLAFVTAALLF
ncbi:PREDICTED: classical arabinogalactan protein 5-like [Ipomoea nil]|uniref:classical arabinogalactan protein 5-like n=1 Tax=Ipomoea nil TaxID=35883 RepID=UPI000901C330|nr:PREDICTED: classical arabinogalactan protein 5-like [Ipomoea nil]